MNNHPDYTFIMRVCVCVFVFLNLRQVVCFNFGQWQEADVERDGGERQLSPPPANTLNMSVDGSGGGAEGGVCTCMYEGTSDQWQFPSPPLQRAAADGEGVWASGMSHTHNELACCAIQYTHTHTPTRTRREARMKKKSAEDENRKAYSKVVSL